MLPCTDHPSTTKNVAPGNRPSYSKSFLGAIKRLILVNKLVGLAPLTVLKIGKKYKVESSPPAEIYSLVLLLTLYAFCAVQTYFTYSSIYADWIFFAFIYLRQVNSLLINITCLQNRQTMLKGLRDIENLGVGLPKRWAATFILQIVCAISIYFSGKWAFLFSFINAILATIPDVLPCIVTICICSLYGCQVEAIRLAIEQLNKDISNLLEQPIKFDFPSIRETMRQYSRLRRICTTLNLAYGQQMFLAVSYTFIELVLWVFFIAYSNGSFWNAYLLLWALCQAVGPVTAIQVCQTTANEVRETLTLPSKIKMKYYHLSSKNRTEIREWEVQLQQQRIYFTASSFFDLDCFQIRTIISSIISYGIILVQNWKLKLK